MSDLIASSLLSSGWSWYVAIATVISLLACVWILRVNSVKKVSSEKADLHGHNEWDGLREYDNPLPRWWSNLFYITIVFSFGYLVLYPGLIVVPGILGWSTSTLYADEVKQVKAETDRLFQTYCTQCHGTDMRGSKGFPNLVDNDWLYPGTPDGIKTTLLEGRNGMMPAFAEVLKPDQITDTAQYVLALSGRSTAAASAVRGEATFKQICSACHGLEGKGNVALGAPNLTDSIWLYGGSLATIVETLNKGRQGKMPAQKDLLGESRVHLLAAYVYAQSQEQSQSNAK
jgi:cytochrome c oxidase cbb3-type subunit III